LSEDEAATYAADAAATHGHDKASIKATIRSALKTTTGHAATIPAPKQASAAGGYADLAAYAAAHGVAEEVFAAAGWSNSVIYEFTYFDKDGDEQTGHSDRNDRLNSTPRRALRFETDAGPRWRLIDQAKPKPKYWQLPGTHHGKHRAWYRLGPALALAAQVGYLVLCNGEASTVVAHAATVPAVCEAGGGEKAMPDHLRTLLRAVWTGPILIALDCDGAGKKAALVKAQQLRDDGWSDVRALDLMLGTGEVLNSLIGAGWSITCFNEYDYSPYNCFLNTEMFEPGKFRIKHFGNKIPMVFSLKAVPAR
jgi:hypothetical protein